MNKEFVLRSFIITTVVLFAVAFIRTLNYGATILNMPAAYNLIDVNISTSPENSDDILFKINDKYFIANAYKDIVRNKFKGNIKTFDILLKNGVDKKIKDLVIFNDVKLHYFKDFSTFEKENTVYENQKYVKYTVPNSVKWNKNSDSYNFRSYLNIFAIGFLSLFSNFDIAFLPFMALLITIIYYINLKGGLPKFKINPYVLAGLILAIGILLRLNTLYDNVIPWSDECFSIKISDPKQVWQVLFWDPGNPPFFFLVLRIWFMIFGVSLISAKTLPFVIGVLSLMTLWFALKKLISTEAANIGLFLGAVNLPLIYYAGEIRGYILEVCIIPLLVFCLFKIFETNKNGYYIFYFLFALIVSNVHYYAILYLGANFLFALFYFLKNKRDKDLLKFFIINLLASIPFVVYFCITAYSSALSNAEFNVWVPKLSQSNFARCILFAFQGIVSLGLCAFFFSRNLLKKEPSLFVNYIFSTVSIIFLSAALFTHYVKPIMYYTYFIIIFPLFIMFVSFLSVDKYKNKYMPILFLVWFFFIQTVVYNPQNRRASFFEHPISFASQFIKQNKTSANIYVATYEIPYKIGYEEGYSDSLNYFAKMSVFGGDSANKKSFLKDNNGLLFTTLYKFKQEEYKSRCFYSEASDTGVCYTGKNLPY